MLLVTNDCLDPTFNLAAEEYLLTHLQQDGCMLWRSRSAVIVGRNQNIMAQVDMEYAKRRNIRLVRRMSGGGAVYHDLGNVNFTFVRSAPAVPRLDFRPHMAPLVDYLRRQDVDVRFDGRSDLAVGDLKISGNAQYLGRKHVLHHGTLLFDTNLVTLERVLAVDPNRFQDKGIDSICKRVTNIRPLLPDRPCVDEFMKRLIDHLAKKLCARVIEFQGGDLEAINRIADRKYRRWEWNFGIFPRYQFKRSLRTAAGAIDVNVDVRRGVIERVRFHANFPGINKIRPLEQALIGVRHQRHSVESVLGAFGDPQDMLGIAARRLLAALF